jgi:metal-dependent amidase/aminoacylase/carboxypeptidase family protein
MTMDARAGARERLDDARDDLIALSHRIHAHPEIGFEEERAAALRSRAASATFRRLSSRAPEAVRSTSRSARSTTRFPASVTRAVTT